MALAEEEIHDLERRAMRVLADTPDYLWDKRTLPIPVEEIADSHFGLLVREVEEMTRAPGCPTLADGQALSGLLLADRREIWINAEEARRWPARRRFTIAHELGHWILHRDSQSALFCRHGTVDPDERAADERPPLPETEAEANQFAAALLMPRPMVEERYTRYEDRSGDRFAVLREAFLVSGAALGRRLHQVIPAGGPR